MSFQLILNRNEESRILSVCAQCSEAEGRHTEKKEAEHGSTISHGICPGHEQVWRQEAKEIMEARYGG